VVSEVRGAPIQTVAVRSMTIQVCVPLVIRQIGSVPPTVRGVILDNFPNSYTAAIEVLPDSVQSAEGAVTALFVVADYILMVCASAPCGAVLFDAHSS